LSLFGTPMQWLVGMLTQFVDTARDDIGNLFFNYLLSTTDVKSGLAFTQADGIRQVTAVTTGAADLLVLAVLLFAGIRGTMEHHSFRAKYTLKAVLPKLLVAIALAHSALPLTQMAIDLNNALGSVALHAGDAITVDSLPWTGSTSHQFLAHISLSQDLFHAVLCVALMVVLVILAMAYVIRYALLAVLVVMAPFAAICHVLPDTRGWANTWVHLFLPTVFMQCVQLFVLRLALTLGLGVGAGLTQTLFALAVLFIMLKVPGALSTSAHLETHAKTIGHHVGKGVANYVHPHHRKAAA
jgi:hypothetical protein